MINVSGPLQLINSRSLSINGTVFGGGKARKLDLLLGDAIARGVTEVVTTGGTGSNHARCTAWAARALGLRCTLALLPEPETAATVAVHLVLDQ